MKKKLLVGIMLVLVLALSGCSGAGSEDKESTTKTESSTDGEKKDSDKKNKKDSKKKEVSLEALESMEVSPIEDFEFRYDGDVVDGLQLCGYTGKDEMVAIPEEVDGKKVVSIASMVFGEDSSVKAIRIPDSVERIYASFLYNKELQYIILGSGLKEIGDGSFGGCHSLKEVILNEGVEKIGEAAFAGMDNLTYMYIPSTVVEIEGAAITTQNIENFVIAGKAGSKAEEYAKEINCTFEAVE